MPSSFVAPKVWLVTVVLAFCSIVYQLLLAQSLSEIFGNSVTRYAVTIGLYLFSMGLGVSSFRFVKDVLGMNIVSLEITLSLVGVGSLFFLFLAALGSLEYYYAGLVLGHILIIAIGFLSGLEIPFLVELDKDQRFSRILAFDFAGTLVGALCFPLLFYPNFSLFSIAFVVAALNFAVALVLVSSLDAVTKPLSVALALTAGTFLVGTAVHHALGYRLITNYEIARYGYNHKWHNNPNWEDIRDNSDVVELFRTPFQRVMVIEDRFGTATPRYTLYLDRAGQLWDAWIETYHQGLSLLSTVFQPKEGPLRIAVLGGGDGILAHELLKNAQVAHIEVIDIDKEFQDFIVNSPHYRKWEQGALANSRVQVHVADAFAYFRELSLRQSGTLYDAIVMDLPGLKSGDKLLHLYSEEMFRFLHKNLKPRGFLLKWHYASRDYQSVMEQTLWSAGFRQILYTCAPPTPKAQQEEGVPAVSCNQEFSVVTPMQDLPQINHAAIILPVHELWLDEIYPRSRWKTLSDTGRRSHSIFHPNYDLLPVFSP